MDQIKRFLMVMKYCGPKYTHTCRIMLATRNNDTKKLVQAYLVSRN